MDIKMKVQDDPLFLGRNIVFFKTLNNKGIYTVEDYINADIEQLSTGSYKRKQDRAYQAILKYKYLQVPLVVDVILDEQYNYNPIPLGRIKKNLQTLGFGESWVSNSIEELCDDNGCLKMIDVIANRNFKSMTALRDFYIQYYNTEMKKEMNVETEVVSDKDSLDSLKNVLVNLLNQRNELDIKISSLLQQINTFEGGKVASGRK